MTSLRVRLLWALLPLLVIVSAVAAGGAYVFMSQHLTAAYDLRLFNNTVRSQKSP